ncbi:MAG TPA: FtsX-like permease family protein [Gemmatimonadaceae bacterium]
MKRRRTEHVPLLERLFAGHHDMLAALRSLRRSPGFVVIAVLSLGLAIGLHATTFALIDAIRHPVNPYAHVEQLFSVETNAQGPDRPTLQRAMYVAARDRHDLFTAFVPWTETTETFEAGSHLVSGTAVTAAARMFDVLDVRPVIGHAFNPNGNNASDAAVISYQLWQQDYGENRDLASLPLTFGGRTYRVIGVMGPAIQFPEDADVWLAMPDAVAASAPSAERMRALIRVHTGNTQARINTELGGLAAQFTAAYANEQALFAYRILPLEQKARAAGDIPGTTYVITFLILLIACLNLANLLMARGLGRRREMAVRLALGASRWAIIRYVLTECTIIVVLGGAWGLLASLWGVSLAQSRMPVKITELGFVAPRLSWHVLLFGLAVIGATVLVAGLIPAIRASRANVHEAMKDGGAGSTGRQSNIYRWLVIAEIAVALIMTVGATSSLRLLSMASSTPFQFGAADRLTTSVVPSRSTCSRGDSLSRFADDMATRAQSVPGVRFAAVQAKALPSRDLVTSDHTPEPIQIVMGEFGEIGYDVVTPNYYEVNELPIVAGRDFETSDERAGGVAIVNQRIAAKLWPLQSPVGRLIKLGPARSNAPWIPVVGVSGVRYRSPSDSTVVAEGPDLAVVRRVGCQRASLAIRATGNDPRVAVAVYHALRAASPGALVTEVRSDKADYVAQLKWQRIVSWLFVAFGIFALVLSTVGVYAILSYVVGQRVREFAMRRALGADAPEVRRLIGKQALEMVLMATAIGGVLAVTLGILVAAFLFRTHDIDAIALGAAEGIVVLASLAACVGPIRQAMRADPVDLLRSS